MLSSAVECSAALCSVHLFTQHWEMWLEWELGSQAGLSPVQCRPAVGAQRETHWLRGSLGPRCSEGTSKSWLPCGDRGCVLIVPVLVCSCVACSHYSRLELSQARRQSAAESSVGFPLRDVGSMESGCSREALQWAELRLFQAAQL